MIKIAIVEDEEPQRTALKNYLERYGEEHGYSFAVKTFSNAISFLDNYSADYGAVFMDIRMPYMNGMDAAHRLRELDKSVIIVFVTSLMQYAINGYEVNALDYIVKPITYGDFALKMSRLVKRLPEGEETRLIIPTSSGKVKLSPSEILWLESEGHHVVYHTVKESYTRYSSLTAAEKELRGHDFFRCSSCYVVNLAYVKGVKGYTVTVGGEELQISQPRKKAFMLAWEEFIKKTND